MMKAQLASLSERIEMPLKLGEIQLLAKFHFRIDLSWVEKGNVFDQTEKTAAPVK